MEALFIKLSMMDSSIDIAHILSGGKLTTVTEQPISIEQSKPLENIPLTEISDPTPTPSVESEPKPETEQILSLEDITNSWSKIIARIEEKNSKIAHFLEEAKLCSFDGKQLLIEIINGHRFHLKTLDKDAGQIESVMNDILNQKIRIKFYIQDNSEKKTGKKKAESMEHPLFMKVLETFEGEIIR
jgi:hypothetical protein